MKIVKNHSLEEEIENELIIMNKEETNIITLNSSASIIWKLLDIDSDFELVCKRMQKIFPHVEPEEIIKDVDETISQFLNAGIIVLNE